MKPAIDETHDPSLRSWVASAQEPTCDFPIQNLPFGVFRRRGGEPARVGVAIGDQILDLAACADAGLLGPRDWRAAVSAGALNVLMAHGRDVARELRVMVSRVLRVGNAAENRAAELLVPQADAELLLPVEVGDYTDFYASLHHATNVGSMFRPDNPLLPNYKYLPIGYHGRASSVVVSGTAVRRPSGQAREDANAPPTFGPSRRLDYELEIGAVVGRGNQLGQAIPITSAEEHLWGLCLLNDWSARDIQAWEYQPLGPFLAKNFATTISPWVVTMDALAPFRAAPPARGGDDPAPLPYLADADDQRHGAFDITVEVFLRSSVMRERGEPPFRVSTGNAASMYWTLAQLLTHHASNGCNLRPGDLLGSGTISGPSPDSRGCLLERTWRGSEPLFLPSGEKRAFLEDGDEVIMRAFSERIGYRRIGFGECAGVVTG